MVRQVRDHWVEGTEVPPVDNYKRVLGMGNREQSLRSMMRITQFLYGISIINGGVVFLTKPLLYKVRLKTSSTTRQSKVQQGLTVKSIL